MQVFEINAQLGQLLEQRGNTGFFVLGVKGINQRVAASCQLQRQCSQRIGQAL